MEPALVTPKDLRMKGAFIRYDAGRADPFDARVFDPEWLSTAGLLKGSSAGRYAAHFFSYAGHEMVLRHFHRGGLMGRLNRDLYLRLGARRSRAFREFELLAEMHRAGLPVPMPVAARYQPLGPFYRADIITRRIAGAEPLQDVLTRAPVSPALWRSIGAEVQAMHDFGVDHSDLNCRNILVGAGDTVWLIDFDKCRKRPPGAWRQANLDRLQRSLVKSSASLAAFHWQREDWAALLEGYQKAEPQPD
ncbi:MAG: 3-deoxy-D-manno-octulosonic acid kinase [Pseudomonadota bacterium]